QRAYKGKVEAEEAKGSHNRQQGRNKGRSRKDDDAVDNEPAETRAEDLEIVLEGKGHRLRQQPTSRSERAHQNVDGGVNQNKQRQHRQPGRGDDCERARVARRSAQGVGACHRLSSSCRRATSLRQTATKMTITTAMTIPVTEL